jgi:hypothetical protein
LPFPFSPVRSARRGLAALAATVVAAAALPASASIVTMHTRESAAGAPNLGSAAANGAWYRDTVTALMANAPGAGFCDASPASFTLLSNQLVCGGPASNIAYGFFVDFDVTAAQGADFSVRLAPDFGRGGALFLDGALLAVNSGDMWWGGSYGNPSQVFQAVGLALNAGHHQLALYGLEGCCDGWAEGQYRVGSSGDWTTFARGDTLQAVAAAGVPEPASLVLVLGALSAMGALAWRGAHQRARARQT